MWWESSGDRRVGGLIETAFKGLNAAGGMDRSENTISYPLSKYDNLRKGMPGE